MPRHHHRRYYSERQLHATAEAPVRAVIERLWRTRDELDATLVATPDPPNPHRDEYGNPLPPVTPTTENPDRPEWASQFRPPRGEFIEWMDADEDSLAAIEREDHSTYVATLSVCRDNGESAGVRIYPDDARRIVGFLAPVAGGAAATPDPPKDAHRPWPIAPDTVMPPRRQPVRWGSRADDPPTEIHNDPQTTKAYLAGLAAGRTEAAASPDERLREALAFYADKSNYTAQNPVGSGAHVWRDMGQRARAALAADRDSLAEKPETDT